MNLSANKNLGQHFLNDQSVIDKIINCQPEKLDNIIEVGPGPGALTKKLAALSKPLWLIEKDLRFQTLLSEYTSSDKILFTDALHVDWQKWAIERNISNQSNWLVSNLPYNISALLFINFVASGEFEEMTLMFQKEVAQKICPLQGEKNSSSSLAIIGHNYYKIQRLCKVLPGAFAPPPKVDSMVLHLKKISNPIILLTEFQSFERFLRQLFSYRRKQIGKVLDPYYNSSIKKVLLQLSIDEKIRAEALSSGQVQELYRALHP